jgi:hypothetical protein
MVILCILYSRNAEVRGPVTSSERLEKAISN